MRLGFVQLEILQNKRQKFMHSVGLDVPMSMRRREEEEEEECFVAEKKKTTDR